MFFFKIFLRFKELSIRVNILFFFFVLDECINIIENSAVQHPMGKSSNQSK